MKFQLDISGRCTVTQVSNTYHEIEVDGDLVSRDGMAAVLLLKAVGAREAVAIAQEEDPEGFMDSIENDQIPDTLADRLLETTDPNTLMEHAGAQADSIDYPYAHAFAKKLAEETDFDAAQLWELAGVFMEMSLKLAADE